MKPAIIYLLFFLTFYGYAIQHNEQKDSIYYHTAVSESSKNPLKALRISDSLYEVSNDEKQKLSFLMLKADILAKQEKRGEAIICAQQALDIAKEKNYYGSQARIYGFLSTQYRTIGYFDKGKEAIEKGLEINSKIKNKVQVTKYIAMANHELAEYAIEEKEYEKALEYLNVAKLAYEQEPEEHLRNFFLGNIEEVFGRCYFGLNDILEAGKHFSKANYYINKAKAGNTLWAALIYQNYSKILLKINKVDSAKIYIKRALKIVDQSDNGSLKEEAYKVAADYFQKINKLDSFRFYDKKYNNILEENAINKKNMVNTTYKILNESKELHTESKFSNRILYITVLSFVLLFAGILIWKQPFYLKDKKEPQSQFVDLNLSKKTEKDILEKLKEFEESNAFLDRKISKSHLVGKLNTNDKYLRYILKKYKDKDYTNYINQLRIDYILKKLKTNPEYRKYKIGYLARESGFSSHSKFSSEFKQFVGVTPSEFINNLKNIGE